MLHKLTLPLIERAERRLGVRLDYTRTIARTGMGLLMRYNRIFGFLDPNKHVPKEAYHVARLRGAISADCGTCVEAEFNLAKNAGVDTKIIAAALYGDAKALSQPLGAVCELADAVVGNRMDNSEAREVVIAAYGMSGLIELSFAMNGAALLPGIKRTMGDAIACDATLMQRLAPSIEKSG